METFNEKGLKDEILKAITELGFENPTPIQEKTIPAILNNGKDLIALAQTGTGKTAGFGLPIIQLVKTELRQVQSLILCPTRELCLQIARDLESFSKYIRGLNVLAVYGGTSIVPQLNDLRSGVQIVVGTPGRTLDLIKRGALQVNHINWLVLDEADEMLQMGFKDELDAILASTPKEKQTLLFSATMPDGVRKIAKNYMHEPDELSSGKKNQGADNVNHVYYMTKASDKYLVLKRIADIHPNIYGIVFCRTRRETKEIADKLIQDGYNADALHGDLSQSQRDFVMQRFRMKALQILVATDVAARGLDVNELTHVINYNLPDDPEIYVHRSGRTGRAGKSGTSISIIHSRETRRVRDIEKLSGKKFEHSMIPSGKEICEKRLFNLVDKVENVSVDYSQIESFLPAILKKLEHLERDELIQHFVSVEFNRFLEYYKNAADLNIGASGNDRGDRSERGERSPRGERGERSPRSDRGDRSDRGSRSDRSDRGERAPRSDRRDGRTEEGYSRFHINVGSKHNVATANLIGMINDATRSKDIQIGKIDVMRNFSFFEVEKTHEKTIIEAFNGFKRDDVLVEVQVANQNPVRERSTDRFKDKGKPSFKDKGKPSFRDKKKDEPRKKRSPKRF